MSIDRPKDGSFVHQRPVEKISSMGTLLGKISSQYFAKYQTMEARHGPSRPRRPVTTIVARDLQLVACASFIKGVNGKFTPHPNLTKICLFSYFWVYLIHRKCDHPILESSHKNETFPFKNTLSRNHHYWWSSRTDSSWVFHVWIINFKRFSTIQRYDDLHL